MVGFWVIRRACGLDDVAKLDDSKTSIVRNGRTFLSPRICLKERMKKSPGYMYRRCDHERATAMPNHMRDREERISSLSEQ